jgi:hypothetical protein
MIDPRSTLTAALREQVAALRVRSHGPAVAVAASTRPGQTATAMASVLAQRIRGLDPADPDRPSKAVRLFLEGELVREFGDTLLDDPAFTEMVDAVEQQMRADREISATVDALGAWLVDRHAV